MSEFVFDTFDPFGETNKEVGQKVHIAVQQRTTRKSITTVQGLAEDLDLKKILRAFKRKFKCNGAVIKHKTMGEVIQLQGDQREGIREFLISQEINTDDQIIIHGH
eukprot:TRINITY_DN568_c0_g1_i1.p1 TRINITY_DN568_c0_g1~~TRINITY_DN568_c0_g1_i1.p1  ORF type:complete len:115 (-),score=30.18 TRINITY_DN568_c0_g1_i1:281-598(-)